MTKLHETSETTIALIFFVMNLDKILRDLFSVFAQIAVVKNINRGEWVFGAAK